MTKVTVVLGEKLFEFPSLLKWEQKATGWFKSTGIKQSEMICIDAAGRICTCGRDFIRADKEDTYPIAVYDTVTQRIMGMPVILDPRMPEDTFELRNL